MKSTQYFMKNTSSAQVDIWLKANNIIHEKSELFYDFICSLFKLIENTYLGDDVTENDIDRINHFNWCWNQIIDNFEKEKIYFESHGEHYDYFWSFFRDSFYEQENKTDLKKVETFLKTIFILHNKKTKSELDMLGDLYKILEKSLKKVV